MPRQTCLRSAFCASENRSPYCDRIAWQRASASAALCGDSLAACGDCCAAVGSGLVSPLATRHPPLTAAAVPSAARRANSRRERAESLGFMFGSPVMEVLALPWAESIIAQDQWRMASGTENLRHSSSYVVAGLQTGVVGPGVPAVYAGAASIAAQPGLGTLVLAPPQRCHPERSEGSVSLFQTVRTQHRCARLVFRSTATPVRLRNEVQQRRPPH